MAQKYTAVINVEMGMVAEHKGEGKYGDILDMGGLQTVARNTAAANEPVHGDGVQLDEIHALVNNTLNETTAGEDDDFIALVSGRSKNTDGEYEISEADSPPFVGHTYIEKTRSASLEAGVKEAYRGWFHPRGKFAPSNHTGTAKTDTITPSTTQLAFTAFPDSAGMIARYKSFDGDTARADAIAWCKAKLGAGASAAAAPSLAAKGTVKADG